MRESQPVKFYVDIENGSYKLHFRIKGWVNINMKNQAGINIFTFAIFKYKALLIPYLCDDI